MTVTSGLNSRWSKAKYKKSTVVNRGLKLAQESLAHVHQSLRMFYSPRNLIDQARRDRCELFCRLKNERH